MTGVSWVLVGGTGGKTGVVSVSTAPSMSERQTLVRREESMDWIPPFARTSSESPREWTCQVAVLLRPFCWGLELLVHN